MVETPSIIIKAYPRLHVGLVDLGDATLRRYGGAGFMLNDFPVEISLAQGRHRLTGLQLLDRRGQANILAVLGRIKERFPVRSARITIRLALPQHVGLGAKTAITLAILKGCELFSGIKIGMSRLQHLSGRGGVSGVGIHGFFKGGFIVDAGHKVEYDKGFAPSSSQNCSEVPPIASRFRIPKSWRFALFLPRGRRYSGVQELRFFRENTPVPKSEVNDTLALIHHGLAPAVFTDDIAMVRDVLREIHGLGFKRRELEGQTGSVRRLLTKIREIPECAGGMSSMGPLIYAVMKKPPEDLLVELEGLARKEGANFIGVCEGRNQGFEVI
ncbi:MAG: beta-ribofuranosylaminobenzene 5'-phosphate synthase family protein [Nitrospirota bacterium]